MRCFRKISSKVVFGYQVKIISCYGAIVLLSKRLLPEFSGPELLSYHCAASALLLLPLAGAPPDPRLFLGRTLIGAALLGGIGGALFYLGLSRIPAQRAAVLTYLEPLVAALVGALAFGEALGPTGMTGAALILIAGAAVAVQR